MFHEHLFLVNRSTGVEPSCTPSHSHSHVFTPGFDKSFALPHTLGSGESPNHTKFHKHIFLVDTNKGGKPCCPPSQSHSHAFAPGSDKNSSFTPTLGSGGIHKRYCNARLQSTAARSMPNSLAQTRDMPLGSVHDRTGVQDTVCTKAPGFPRADAISSEVNLSVGTTERGDRLSPPATRCKNYPPSRSAVGVLQPVFRCAKERRRVSPYSRSEGIKPSHTNISLQNVDAQATHCIHKAGGLVHEAGPTASLFSCCHSRKPQTISEVSFRGQSVRISSPTVRASHRASPVHENNGRCHIPFERTRDAYFRLHRRLPSMCPISAAGLRAHTSVLQPPGVLGFSNKPPKKCADTSSDDTLPGSRTELQHISCRTDTTTSGILSPVSLALPIREESKISRLPSPFGSNGIGNSGGTTGPAFHERHAEMGILAPLTARAQIASEPSDNGFPPLHTCASSVERPRFLDTGSPTGTDFDSPCGDNGRVTERLGRHSRGPSHRRCMVNTSAPAPHKHSGADCSIPGTEALLAFARESTRFDPYGQHISGFLHKSPGRSAVAPASPHSPQHSALGSRSHTVTQSHSCAGCAKCTSRHVVEGLPLQSGMATTPARNRGCVETLRARGGGFICITREHTLQTVLLNQRQGCATGHGCAVSPVAKNSTVCISPSPSDPTCAGEGEGGEPLLGADCPVVDKQALAGGDFSLTGTEALATPPLQRPSLSDGGTVASHKPVSVEPTCLPRERDTLSSFGLPLNVIATIQSARAPSTRSVYDMKWRAFERWCDQKGIIPFQCSITHVLTFLQELFEQGLAYSTLKVYLSAISACHVGYDGVSPGAHPLATRFLKGVRRLRPATRSTFPSWDLSLVLNALCQAPFEPLQNADIKIISYKTALLLALASAKRVSEITAFSIHPSCIEFSADNTRVTLRPNVAFIPKVSMSYGSCDLQLTSFHPPPFLSEEQERLHSLCPVRALRLYLDKTSSFRRTDQLFVCFATGSKGRALSTQRLSHWIVEVIAMAYRASGNDAPVIRAHSTRGVAASWAAFKGVSVQTVCAAAGWATPHTFTKHYRLDVTASTVAHAVLEAGGSKPV